MPESLSDRVRQVVQQSGLSQAQFADQIGIDGPKLTKSLSGQRRFTSFELASIAEQAGETVDWLITGRSRGRVFAHRAVMNTAAGDEIGRQKIDLIEDRVAGLRFMGRPLDFPALPVPVRSGRKIDQGAKTAIRYAEALGVGVAGLSTPALIDHLESRFGINVVVAQLPDGCDGLSFASDGLRVIVLATSDTSPHRQRFTLAHELGHIAFDDAFDSVISERMWESRELEELRANAFAASFLAPAAEVRAAIGGQPARNVFDSLVLDFQVSPESMAWRLFNEGIINADEQRVLATPSSRTVAMRAGRPAEYAERIELASQERPPLRLVGAYLAAYADGETTLKPAASLLGWSIERAEASFGDAAHEDSDPVHTL
ncbi:helix-turn-helix domain-containing protein [Leifsonia sp. P73]|uniref:helix-turn-helix domain-containing protein n=1 Tax=Leifsonia sp. P73 TaxID=3423959 RepID=UPI003DA2BDC2